MELRQYLAMRKDDVMEELYSLMEDLITQILKVRVLYVLPSPGYEKGKY